MIHLGDITKIDGKRIEPVDVIVGGSPCQDLSVAGKRAGLAGERSGLYMDQIRIIKEMRDADHQRGRPDELCRPRYMVWENVPGAFSSQKGADFAAVLEEVIRVVEPKAPDVPVPEKGWPTAGCIYDDMGRWSVAWRVHDAQFWGVPQRRRRIALVADFGGLSAPEVLFERKGLRWDPAPSGEARKGATADAEGSSGGASRTYNIGSYHSNAWKSDNPHSGVYETEVSKTLDALNCGYPACNQGGTAVVCMATQQGGAEVRADDRAGESAGAGGDGRLDAVSGGFCQESAKARSIGWGEELAPTLTAGAVPGVVSAVTLEPGIDAREGGTAIVAIHQNASGELRTSTKGYTLGTSSNASARNTPMIMEPVLFNGSNVTSPINAANPQPGDPRHTLSTDSRNLVVVADPIYCLQGNGIDRADTAGCNGKGWREDVCYTLNTIDRPAVCIGFSGNQSEKARSLGIQVEISPTLRGGEGGNQKPMVYDARGNGDGETVCTITGDHENRVTGYTALCMQNTGQGWWNESQIGATLRTPSGGDSTKANLVVTYQIEATLKSSGVHAVPYESVDGTNCIKKHVRRLTPLECERLQGYQDGWTDIGEWVDSKGKRHDSSDSARYKALGNSIALPFWHWLFKRISAQYVGTPTLGSLFDGISGFCLIWARCNGAKNCRWSSEIEEFPMAVTRKHFGDEKTGEVGDIEKYL